jgi:hypothetical protein
LGKCWNGETNDGWPGSNPPEPNPSTFYGCLTVIRFPYSSDPAAMRVFEGFNVSSSYFASSPTYVGLIGWPARWWPGQLPAAQTEAGLLLLAQCYDELAEGWTRCVGVRHQNCAATWSMSLAGTQLSVGRNPALGKQPCA